MNKYSVRTNLQKLRYHAIALNKQKNDLSNLDLQSIKEKIQALWLDISLVIGSKQLRKCLGASLVAGLMMTSQLQAQNFADPVPMYDVEFNGILIPELGDIDQDGDLDILGLAADYGGGAYGIEFGFQENIGDVENPDFLRPMLGVFGLTSDVFTEEYGIIWEMADMDADGDTDLIGYGLSYSYATYGYQGSLLYLENTGTASEPMFGDYVKTELNTENHLSRELTVVDFDDDGDLDVLVLGGQYEEVTYEYFFNILYYENIGDETNLELADVVINPNGFKRLLAPEGFEEAAYYFASLDMADFDLDGDLDGVILANSYDQDYGSKFLYAENSGSNFSLWTEIENISLAPDTLEQFILKTAGDLDGDGDVDLFYTLAGEEVDDDDRTNTFFVENLAMVSSTEETLKEAPVSLFPTVTSSMINVVFEELNDQAISVLSAEGKLVKQFSAQQWNGLHMLNMTDLAVGQYFLRIIDKEEVYNMPFIKH